MSAAARTHWTAHAIRLAWLLPGLLALLVSYALLRFLLLPVLPGLGPEVAASRAQGPGLWPAALNSLRLATLAAAGAVLPAVWLGLMLERRAWRGRGMLALALWLLFLLPGYLAAAGWQIVLGLPALRGARWKVGGDDGELLGLHAAPPPERARLSIDPAGLFAFPAGLCGEEDTTRWATRIAAGKQAGSAALRSDSERAGSLLHPLVRRWMPGTGR